MRIIEKIKNDYFLGIFKTNRSYRLVVDSMGTLFTKLVLIFLKMGIGVITARVLGPGGRGVFVSTVQTSGITNTIGTLSIGESLIYLIGAGRIRRSESLGTVLFLFLCFSTLLCTFFFLLFDFFGSTVFSKIRPELLTLVYFFIPGMMLEYFATSALRGLKEFYIANKLTIITRLLILTFITIALLAVKADIYTGLIAYIIAITINALIYITTLWKMSNQSLLIAWGQISMILKYGFKVHIGTLLNEVEYRLDIFFLLFFLTASVVGIYSVGVIVAQIVWYVCNSANTVLFPYLAETEDDDRDNLCAKVLKYTFYINIIVIVSLIIIGKPLIILLYGFDFKESYFIFLLLSPGLLLDSIGRSLSVWLKGCDKPLDLSWISGFSLLLNISMNFILIPTFGMYGAAMSSVISYALRFVLLVLIFKKRTTIPIKRFFYFNNEEVIVFKGFVKKVSNAFNK